MEQLPARVLAGISGPDDLRDLGAKADKVLPVVLHLVGGISDDRWIAAKADLTFGKFQEVFLTYRSPEGHDDGIPQVSIVAGDLIEEQVDLVREDHPLPWLVRSPE